MAKREDFLLIAEMLGVTLDSESRRHTRMCKRSGDDDVGSIVLAYDYANVSVWISTSKKAVEYDKNGIPIRLLSEEGEHEYFYSSQRPGNGIRSEFVFRDWDDPHRRCNWLIYV